MWLVTIRCARAQLRLKPEDDRNEVVGFWFARAMKRFSGVHVFCLVTMGNHIHAVVQDMDSELSRYMGLANGQIAKDVNVIDGTRGQFFERRFAATEIIDKEALVNMIVYSVTNPSKLVGSYKKWPGLVLWHGICEKRTFKRLRRGAYFRALKRAEKSGAVVNKDDFYDYAELILSPVEGVDDAEIAERIEVREKEIAREREEMGLPPMSVEKVMERDPFDAPSNPKRSPMPLCHASTKEDWTCFRDTWRAFVKAYREASALFRRGALTVLFPDYSFRPPLPLHFVPS